jgi:hypothetical protein
MEEKRQGYRPGKGVIKRQSGSEMPTTLTQVSTTVAKVSIILT